MFLFTLSHLHNLPMTLQALCGRHCPSSPWHKSPGAKMMFSTLQRQNVDNGILQFNKVRTADCEILITLYKKEHNLRRPCITYHSD